MSGALAGNRRVALIPERAQVDAGEQMLAGAEQDRPEREVQLVDQAGAQVLPDRRDAAAEADVACRRPLPCARSSAAWMPSVTKWNVVPPFIASGARA